MKTTITFLSFPLVAVLAFGPLTAALAQAGGTGGAGGGASAGAGGAAGTGPADASGAAGTGSATGQGNSSQPSTSGSPSASPGVDSRSSGPAAAPAPGVDRDKGTFSLKTSEGTLDLHAPPSALAGVNKGDQMAVEIAVQPVR
jgi:hypothetical protein